MQNPSDKDLDDLFRRAAQKSEAEADSGEDLGNWQALAAKMDASMNAVIWTGRLKNTVSIILLIGLIGLVWYGIDKDNSTQDDTAGGSPARSGDQPLTDGPVATNSTSIHPMRDDKLVVPSGTMSIHSHDFHSRVQLLNIRNHNSTGLADSVPVEPGIPQSANANERVQPVVGEPGASEVLEDSVEEASTVGAQSSNEQPEQEHTKRSKGARPLFVRILVSPDYSSVNATNPGQLGFNLGALLEYRLSEKLSISTGLIRARKVYTATNLEYNGYNADEVDGDCRMWDIPVNVYYNFIPEGKWSFYAGAGLSSYLMSEENYVYKVQSGYGWYTYDQQVRNKNHEWFSILNLSVGIQKNLTGRLAVQVEPYIKAPLAGVGEGDVSLASFGAFFGLTYKLSPLTK